VPGVGQIAFDPVQIRVDDGAVSRRVLLRALMSAFPVAFRFPPQCSQRQIEAGWRLLLGGLPGVDYLERSASITLSGWSAGGGRA
jgi:hypothetical protein